MTTTTLRLNPDIQLWPFDGAAQEAMLMCEVPRGDGSVARFVLPARLVEVLRLFDGRPTADVSRACEEAGTCAAQDLQRLVMGVLVPRGFLLEDGAEVPATVRARGRQSYMTVRVPLLRPGLVTPIARCLGWLFVRPVFTAVSLVLIASHLLFYLRLAPAAGLTVQEVRGSHAGALALLMIASTVLHEFGHAAAAARFGCRRLVIGWGMYYHMQVLYTDLSEAWRLNRVQRAVVDVGGMYFQAIFATALLGVHWATGSVVPLYCFVVTDLAIAGSLNPFFRMDGYWLMSDLLGVPNLHAQSVALVRRAAFRFFGRQDSGPAPLPLGRWSLALFGIYSVLGLVFFVLAFGFTTRVLVASLAVTYPEVLGALWTAATARPFSALEVGSALFAVAWRGLVLFGMARLTYNIAARFLGGCSLLLKLLLEARGSAPAARPAGTTLS